MYRLCFAALVGLAIAASSSVAEDDTAGHVVIISVDGFPAYLLTDPRAPIPTFRKLAEQGVAAEGMAVSNPSVTWPNHTSLVTGVHPIRHSVLLNGVIVRPGPGLPVEVDPRRDKAELVAVPTLFDIAHGAGLSTAEINWPCTRGAETLDDSFPDAPEMIAHMTPRLRDELVAEGILEDDTDETFRANSPAGRDLIWTLAACHVVDKRQPNLLLFHLLNVDAVHHRYGPQTWAGYTAIAYADAMVARLLDALDEAGIRQQTTIMIVSDHGFISTPQTLLPNVLLRQEGLLSSSRPGRIDEARVYAHPSGGMALVYATEPASRDEDLQRARELFSEQEGIDRILEPDEFADYGMPHPRENPRMADMVLVALEGYGFARSADGESWVVSSHDIGASLGHHGFLSTHPKMKAAFIAAGRGIDPEAELGMMESIDVAPTAARLLDLEMPAAEGRVLEEILTEPAIR